MNENMNVSQGFGWDDEVEESMFELIPDGDYRFEVTGFERSWYEAKAGSKIASCNQADIEFTIKWTNESGDLKTNKLTHKLKLSRTLQFLIYQFFESIGLRKKGDGTTKMPWDQIVGKTGICEIGHHEDSKGTEYNDIVRCYPPESAPTVISNGKVAESSPKFEL